jgi:hypothetical protein
MILFGALGSGLKNALIRLKMTECGLKWLILLFSNNDRMVTVIDPYSQWDSCQCTAATPDTGEQIITVCLTTIVFSNIVR